MKYITVIRDVGNTAYGYNKVYEYLDTARRPIVQMQETKDGVAMTLFDKKGNGHTRVGPNDPRVYAIADAWLKEQGYTEKLADLADVRADND